MRQQAGLGCGSATPAASGSRRTTRRRPVEVVAALCVPAAGEWNERLSFAGAASSTAVDRAPTPADACGFILPPSGRRPSTAAGRTRSTVARSCCQLHRSGKNGAKYTKSHSCDAVRLAYVEKCADKKRAAQREAKGSRAAAGCIEKMALPQGGAPTTN